jgi:lipase chaperone LimK
MGTEPPQPLLWFHQGLTYHADYDAVLDAHIVQSIEAANVRTVVIEKESFFGTEARLSHFSLLAAHIYEHYELSLECGNFHIFKRLKS